MLVRKWSNRFEGNCETPLLSDRFYFMSSSEDRGLCKTIAFCKAIQQLATKLREAWQEGENALALVHPSARCARLGNAEAMLRAAGALRQDTRVLSRVAELAMAETRK